MHIPVNSIAASPLTGLMFMACLSIWTSRLSLGSDVQAAKGIVSIAALKNCSGSSVSDGNFKSAIMGMDEW